MPDILLFPQGDRLAKLLANQAESELERHAGSRAELWRAYARFERKRKARKAIRRKKTDLQIAWGE